MRLVLQGGDAREEPRVAVFAAEATSSALLPYAARAISLRLAHAPHADAGVHPAAAVTLLATP